MASCVPSSSSSVIFRGRLQPWHPDIVTTKRKPTGYGTWLWTGDRQDGCLRDFKTEISAVRFHYFLKGTRELKNCTLGKNVVQQLTSWGTLGPTGYCRPQSAQETHSISIHSTNRPLVDSWGAFPLEPGTFSGNSIMFWLQEPRSKFRCRVVVCSP